MVSEKQLEANRRNAQKSTGPTSREGKERVRINAVTHGLRSETLDVLPNEDPAAFAAHLDALLVDLRPTGASQVHLARQIALFAWKIERADRYEAAVLTRDILDAVHACECDDDDTPALAVAAALASFDPSNEGERLRRYQLAMHRAMLRTIDALARMKRDAERRRENCANEAISLEATRPSAADSGGVGRPAPSENISAPLDRPIKAISPASASPNKAISPMAVQASSSSAGKRSQPSKHEAWPIDLDLLSDDPRPSSWLDVSCLRG